MGSPPRKEGKLGRVGGEERDDVAVLQRRRVVLRQPRAVEVRAVDAPVLHRRRAGHGVRENCVRLRDQLARRLELGAADALLRRGERERLGEAGVGKGLEPAVRRGSVVHAVLA